MSKKCLIFGAGAIGKCVAGYIFTSLGYETLFAEKDRKVIDDINARGGYGIHASQLTSLRGLRACEVTDPALAAFAADADVIVTAVGMGNLPDVANTVADALCGGGQSRRLCIMLFENGSHLTESFKAVLTERLGALPQYISVSHACIERISKIVGSDGVSEEFIPPVMNAADFTGTDVEKHPDYFTLTDDMNRYYYRKLFINNIGHATMGYMGLNAGYATTVQAIADPRIRAAVSGVWSSAGRMVEQKFNFTRAELDNYTAGRISCYENAALADSLTRLSRDARRKLGRGDRIIGTAEKCLELGLDTRVFIPTLFYAMKYLNRETPEAGGTPDRILRLVCGLSDTEPLYKTLLTQLEEYERTV